MVEKDPAFSACSIAHTNSFKRQQFLRESNVRISQFTADSVKSFREYIDDLRVPDLSFQSYGYMYLEDNEAFAGILRESQAVQASCGADTKVRSAESGLTILFVQRRQYSQGNWFDRWA